MTAAKLELFSPSWQVILIATSTLGQKTAAIALKLHHEKKKISAWSGKIKKDPKDAVPSSP